MSGRGRGKVWRVLPNEDGEGGETWESFACDTDMQRIAAEERCADLETKCADLQAQVERLADELGIFLDGLIDTSPQLRKDGKP